MSQNHPLDEPAMDLNLRNLILMSQQELEQEFFKRKQEVKEKFAAKLEQLDSEVAMLRKEEEHFRREDESKLEDVSQQHDYILGLEHKQMKWIYIIEEQENTMPAKFEVGIPRSSSLSETCLYNADDEVGRNSFGFPSPGVDSEALTSRGRNFETVSQGQRGRRRHSLETASSLRTLVVSKSLTDFNRSPTLKPFLRASRSQTPDGRNLGSGDAFTSQDMNRSSSYPA